MASGIGSNSSVGNNPPLVSDDLELEFTSALSGQTVNDMIQRTTGRLESLHSEGVHRLSEMCYYAVSQLLLLGKSVISNANKVQDEEPNDDIVNIDWPEDCVEKAKIIRAKAQSMTGYIEATTINEKVKSFSQHFQTDQTTAVAKIIDGLQYLSYVVVSTSMPSA
ncbi:hypothetical protein ACFE04_021818 [Oxalis oulophora]